MPSASRRQPARRAFLKRSAIGGLAATSAPWLLAQAGVDRLGSVSAAEAALPAGSVAFDASIEPLVHRIHEALHTG